MRTPLILMNIKTSAARRRKEKGTKFKQKENRFLVFKRKVDYFKREF